jgi:ABC-type antimicrobial peptide transport system permease subunit
LFGVVALAHVLMLAVRRRRHELGVLRALGWRPAEASSTIRWQAGIIALLAVVIGIPAGVVIGRLLWVAIAEPIHVLPDVAVPAAAIAIVVVALPFVALALASIPARQASRLRPAQVLRSE